MAIDEAMDAIACHLFKVYLSFKDVIYIFHKSTLAFFSENSMCQL